MDSWERRLSLNGNTNGHQADDPNNLENSEESKPQAQPLAAQDAMPVQLAFGFDLAPQEEGHRTPLSQRLEQSGLSCYWDVYQALLDTPPEWEIKFWKGHPARKREWPRKALYIAWAAAPSSARQPRTQNEFAEAVGIT